MKKTLANIRTLAALLIASATLAACSNDDGIVDNAQPAQQQAPQVYTLTLQAGKADNAQTRALELDGTKLVAKWAAGDVLTVKKKSDYSDVTGTLTASNVSADGKSCTFSGTITGSFTAGDKLYLYYHLMPGLSSYTDQTGTLASAAAHDVAFAEVTVQSVSGSEITISETSASFTTLTAALKMTLTDGTNALNATSLKISVGSTDIFTFSPTAETYSANGDGILYFTLPCQADVESMASLTSGTLTSAEITFTATAGGETYTATKTGYPFAAGKYYATTLTMTKAAPSYTMAAAATTSDKGKLICTAGHIHVYGEDAACTAGRVAKIIYVGTNGHATYNHGLALALEDMSTKLTWDNSGTNNGGNTAAEWCSAWNASTPVTDAEWLLASKDQWNYMLGTDGAGSYTDLRDGFESVGGSNMKKGSYWSSTEDGTDNAWNYSFSSFGGDWYSSFKNSNNYNVRACLAF